VIRREEKSIHAIVSEVMYAETVFSQMPFHANAGCRPSVHFQRSNYCLTLVLSRASLGELEGDTTASESAVDLRVGVESVVNTTALLLVKDDLEKLATILLSAEALADDLDGVDEISQDSVVHSSQSSGSGTLLLLGVARAGRTLGAGENAARSQDEDVTVRELLLELTGQARRRS
jgi:hypothetical protein